jgi:acetyltransferase-like isoleucine patch superfamily enzyme
LFHLQADLVVAIIDINSRNPLSYIKFIKAKTSGYSLAQLIFLEIESLLTGTASLIPTSFGVFARGFCLRVLAKKSAGMPWIQPRVTLVHLDRISFGEKLGINSGTYINGIGGISFGNHVLIGSNVTISSGMHPIEGRVPAIFERKTVPKEIIIGDDVWIGAGAVIMPGVRLATGTVVGANAVVTKDTEPYSVVVGVPAVLLRVRDDI